MPLFIVRRDQFGNEYPRESRVMLDLADIVEGDGSFELNDNGNRIEVGYNSPNPGNDAIRDLVEELVNSDIPVEIGGWNCCNTLPDGSELCVRKGVTLFDPTDLSWVVIIYDTTRCGGSGHFVFGQSNQQIPFPNEVILYHELYHASEVVNNTLPTLPNGNFDETQSERDAHVAENMFRADRGLPLRHLTRRDGGCNGQIECNTQPDGCLIATASFDSPLSPQVEMFRKLRDNFLGESYLGIKFFSELLSEYYQFSPAIANDMKYSPNLKKFITYLVVIPLLEFFAIAELSMKTENKQELSAKIEHVLKKFTCDLEEHGFERKQIMSMYDHLSELKINLNNSHYYSIQLNNDSFNISDLFHYLEQSFKNDISNNVFLTWSLLTPLTIFWNLVCSNLQLGINQKTKSLFHKEILEWVGSIPIPVSFIDMDQKMMKKELYYLKAKLFLNDSVRYTFGKRLHQLDHNNLSYNIESLLKETEFLPNFLEKKDMDKYD